MRTGLRSLLTMTALLASCAATPAFAEAPPPTGFAAVDAAAQASQPAPSAPSAPTAPAEVPAVPAIAEADERDPRVRIIDAWFATHFHGLGPHLTEYLHGRLLAAVEELKALLLELPLS